ncbi:MAG: hypothetical protein AAGM67_13280, partial [Bacteroidota bacterium]
FDTYLPNVTSHWVERNPSIFGILTEAVRKNSSCKLSVEMGLEEDIVNNYMTEMLQKNYLAKILEQGLEVNSNNLVIFCLRREYSDMRKRGSDAHSRSHSGALTDTEMKKKKQMAEPTNSWGQVHASYENGGLKLETRPLVNPTSKEHTLHLLDVDDNGNLTMEPKGGDLRSEILGDLHFHAAVRRVETLIRKARPKSQKELLCVFEQIREDPSKGLVQRISNELGCKQSVANSYYQKFRNLIGTFKSTPWLEEYV